MDDETINAVVSEIARLLAGREPGKIFQLGPASLAIDFGLREHGYLFISGEPATPRFYLIKRRVRDLEKQSTLLTQFALRLRKELAQAKLRAIRKLRDDRIVSLDFDQADELGYLQQLRLIVQLTGRSANLFLLDDADLITARARETKGVGQSIGEAYKPPLARTGRTTTATTSAVSAPGSFESVSAALDAHYTALAAKEAQRTQLAAALGLRRKEISRRRKLVKQLEKDLAEHSEAEKHKRIGDLLLANVSAAKRHGNLVKLIDYFSEGVPEIEIEIDESLTIPEEASRRFELYTRAKRARAQITRRIEKVKAEIIELELSSVVPGASESLPPALAGGSRSLSKRTRTRERVSGVRRYASSDGLEILVGRAARDNDNLTFKVAKPNDLWLHAADYPGSHVIVRNPTRKDIPHRTLVEAAQLAAHFSQANKDPKVDVHYTHRKFLSKPKGAAPGLVRMSRFKSMTVSPAEPVPRVM